MAQEGEARDVGGCVRPEAQLARQANGRLVECRHGVRGHAHAGVVEKAALVRGGENARAERLGEHECVSHLGTAVLQALVQPHEARHREAVLGLVVVDRVAARYDALCAPARLGATGQDLPGDLDAQAVGEAQEVEREHGPTAHGVDVGEGVSGRDLAKQERVVHHRREEVRRGDEAAPVAEVPHASVV